MVHILSAILSAIAWLRDKLKREPNKIVRVADESVNREAARVIIEGNVTNSPIVIVQDGKIAFAGNEADIIRARLSKQDGAELLEQQFSAEYMDYLGKAPKIKYKHNFIKKLDEKYRALIKSSDYIKELYAAGDMDLAERKKNELDRSIDKGSHFCNLYSVGYIPQLLDYIEKTGVTDKNIIQQLLDHTINYEGAIFVNRWTEKDGVIDLILKLMEHKIKYIAVHGFGTAAPIMDKIHSEIMALTKFDRLLSDSSYTNPPVYEKKGRRRILFIFNKDGARIHEEFTKGEFTGFS
jgi:hypothetical protein